MKHPSTEQLLDLVGQIYATALQPGRMTQALQALNDCVHGTFAQVYTYHRGTGQVLDAHLSETVINAEGHERYVRDWSALDPRPKKQLELPLGSVMLCHEHFDQKYVDRSSFYQEFFIPVGLRWAMGTMYHGGDGTSTVVAGLRAPDLPRFDSAQARTLALAAPHFRRAAALRQEMLCSMLRAASIDNVLAGMRHPSLVVDDRGRVLASNDAATSQGEGIGFRLLANMVRFDTPEAQLDWVNAIKGVKSAKTARSFVLPAAGAARWFVHLVPWQHLQSAPDAAEARMLFVTFELEARGCAGDLRHFAATYRLTKAETDILLLIGTGVWPKQIAHERGASINTIRSQIASILAKCGCRSQREMLAKAARAVR